jgi:ATP-dependent Clp protease ATP-binding subunit ClpA
LSEPVEDWLLDRGLDPQYGARHLARAFETLVLQPLSRSPASAGNLRADLRDGDIVFSPVG